MKFSIDEVTNNLIKKEDGIYYSKMRRQISYPEDGNDECYQIEEGSFWFAHRNKVIASVACRYSAGETFFDVGGGNGFVAKGLQDEGLETVLVEPGVSGAKNAKKRGLKRVICSTLEDAHFYPQSLGAIGLFDVVEHIEDDMSFLKDIHTYLQYGQYLYITVPSYGFLWSNEDVKAGHYRRYTLKELEEKLEAAGFLIEYSTYFFSILPLPIYLLRVLPEKLKLMGKNKSEVRNDHQSPNKLFDALIDKVWAWELRRVRNNKKIPFGGSCLVVAKKKPYKETR